MTLEEEIDALDKAFGALIRKSPKNSAEMEEMERLRILLMNALLKHAKLLTEDVLEAGIRIKSVWDFVNTADKYPEAIPILIKHLSRPYHHSIKEGIVRALAVKEAKGIANKAVLEEFRKLPKETPDQPWVYHYRWAFGNTMTVIITEDDLDDLIKIVTDESNGDSRDSFVVALGKLKSPKVVEVLNQLCSRWKQARCGRGQKSLKQKSQSTS